MDLFLSLSLSLSIYLSIDLSISLSRNVFLNVTYLLQATICSRQRSEKTLEKPYDKTNKMACAPSEDSDQPGHPPSLISLRCPHEGTLGSVPIEHTAKTLIRLGGCPG